MLIQNDLNSQFKNLKYSIEKWLWHWAIQCDNLWRWPATIFWKRHYRMSQSSFKPFKTFQRWSVPGQLLLPQFLQSLRNATSNLTSSHAGAKTLFKICFKVKLVVYFLLSSQYSLHCPNTARDSRKKRKKFQFSPLYRIAPKATLTPLWLFHKVSWNFLCLHSTAQIFAAKKK